ncbi:hypothetical protein RHMOL_Rhmol06G0105800 [Rhododendron molle]|uniref:Uncharacterized protein n=1 Tax=Rhododendron molle TaxID=49168 RepID=A0ACC0NCH2_RHOML|nr:hypothetical protein RHMOL_Rhmol06G0105800 [Rhododendron molle]
MASLKIFRPDSPLTEVECCLRFAQAENGCNDGLHGKWGSSIIHWAALKSRALGRILERLGVNSRVLESLSSPRFCK